MVDGSILAKRHLLDDYYREMQARALVVPTGVVFVEPDVHCVPLPDEDPEDWAKLPLKEIDFLRSLIEQENGNTILAIVFFAPFNLPRKTSGIIYA